MTTVPDGIVFLACGVVLGYLLAVKRPCPDEHHAQVRPLSSEAPEGNAEHEAAAKAGNVVAFGGGERKAG